MQGRERESPNNAVMSAVEVRKNFSWGGSQGHAGLNIFSMVFFSCETYQRLENCKCIKRGLKGVQSPNRHDLKICVKGHSP